MDVPALSLPGLQDIRQPPPAIQLDPVPVEQLAPSVFSLF